MCIHNEDIRAMLHILTAADERYARTLAQFLLSLRRHLPHVPCIVYDLGFTPTTRAWLRKNFSEIHIETFAFARYPGHLSKLYTCAWKSVIIDRYVRERKRVLWLDAASVIRSADLLPLIQTHLDKEKIFILNSQSPLDRWCHGETFKRMKTPLELRRELILPAGVIGLDGGMREIRKLVGAWKSYCLDEGTIAPYGANRENHRYDQSVLNNLLYAELHSGRWIFSPAGEIDISSTHPIRGVSTRNFTAIRSPLWLDPLLRARHDIIKFADQKIWKLRHLYATCLSGLHRLTQEKFEITVRIGPLQKVLKSPWHQYWADPFCITEGKRHWIFFENYRAREGKGVLAAVAINNQGQIVEPYRAILERRYHLSYPQIFRARRQFYMIPESCENRTVDLYRATNFPSGWVLERRLLYDIDAADCTLLRQNGMYWLFCAVRARTGGARRSLQIYFANELTAKRWQAHPVNQKALYSHLPYSSGRGAGRFFRRGHHLYRPMQWSENFYGQGLRFMRVTALNPREYNEEPAEIPALKAYESCHHIEINGQIIVTDFKTRSRWRHLVFMQRRKNG